MATGLPLKVEITGMKQLQEAFKKSPKTVSRAINPAIRRTLFLLQGKAIPKTPIDRGQLRTWKTIFSDLKGTLQNRSPSAMFVHGDGSAKRSKPHWPPREKIERWANRHGINPLLVARAISLKGTKLIPFLQEAIDENKRAVDNIFNRSLKDIVNRLSK